MSGKMVTETWFGSLRWISWKNTSETGKGGIGILAFEVASLMLKVVNMWHSLTENEVNGLREQIVNSVGIQKLVSDNAEYLMDLAVNEIIENFGNVAKSVARLGKRCIHGVQFIIQSSVKGPKYIDLRVESFLQMFESKLYEMTSDQFKNNVNALIDMKLEKHKNLNEESGFYWREISDGTLKFDRREAEVAALRQLTQQELIDFFNENIKAGAPRKKTLSVRVYGSLHAPELKEETSESAEPHIVHIDDIFGFRRSQPLYGSFKGGFVQMKL